MEFFRISSILASLLLVVVAVSAQTNNITFEGQDPEIAVAGSNVTIRWRYTGAEKILACEFQVELEDKSGEDLIYYREASIQYYPSLKQYAELIQWDGDYADNEYAFKLVNVKDFTHQKNFWIILTEESGSALKAAKELLLIFISPQVKLKLDKTNVTVGDRVTIQCDIVKGRPTPTLTWYLNNKVISGARGRFLFNNDVVEAKDAGYYRCMAENSAGKNTSEEIKLTVNPKENDNDGTDGKDGPSARGSSDGLGGGAIAGIVIAILVVVVVVIVVVYVVFFRRRTSGAPESKTRAVTNDDDDGRYAMVSQTPEKDQVWL